MGVIYALPNLYGEDPAIQITATHGATVNKTTLHKISAVLEQDHIKSKSITLENGAILTRFHDSSIQLRAREALIRGLGDKFIVAFNLAPATPHWLATLGAKPIKLGLDLRGGVHFLIEIDMSTTIDKLEYKTLDTLRKKLRANHIIDTSIYKLSNNSLAIRFRDEITRNQAISYINVNQPHLVLSKHRNNTLKAELSYDYLKKIHEDLVTQNIIILRNRINRLGLDESMIQRQGTDRIVVELPGIQDTARAKEILGATATLEFRLVNTLANTVQPTSIYDTQRDSEVKYISDGRVIVLSKDVILTGEHITDATLSIDEYDQAQVNISLDTIGGTLISSFSKDNIGKTIATLFVEYKDSGKKDANGRAVLIKKEEIINIANIQSHLGDRFRITGISNINEARQLILLLRAGALSAPIQIVEERIIGPILGKQNITQGLKACVYGLIISIFFMIAWYRKFGIIATNALLANLVLIMACMSLLPGTTLSMPGIAGILLTLVVTVDATVLINERIKEELKNGRSFQMAIHEGYKGAFSSIMDANITTLITAVILYTIGTGSIKGFAITTVLGVATSMFTSIIGTRAIVNLIYGRKRINKLSI